MGPSEDPNMKPGRFTHLPTLLAALCATLFPTVLPTLLATLVAALFQPWKSVALAEGPPTGKGPEVSTVGGGPYLGPLPEELVKLELTQAPTEAPTEAAKESATETISEGLGNELTSGEIAKLTGAEPDPGSPQPATDPILDSTIDARTDPADPPIDETSDPILVTPEPNAPAPAPKRNR
jgi:hypothetical protein